MPNPHEGHHGWHEPGSELAATTIATVNISSPHHVHSPPTTSHEHSHSGTALSVLNETQVLEGHAPDPLSYLAFDLYGTRHGFKSGWGDDALDTVVYSDTLKSHGWWMIWHVVLMTIAFFGALPIAIALRSSSHPLQPVAHTAFVLLSTLGWIAGSAYRKHTPDLYIKSSHTSSGTILVLLSIGFFVVERVGSVRRFLSHVQSISERRSGRLRWSEVWKGIKGRQSDVGVDEDVMLMDTRGADVVFDSAEGEGGMQESRWANEDVQVSFHQSYSGQGDPARHNRQYSIDSATSTLHNSPTGDTSFDFAHRPRSYSPIPVNPLSSDGPHYSNLGRMTWTRRFTFISERLLVVMAYIAIISGTTVYVGGCRDNYLNGCLAHLIKGSIFFLYGLVTFARYLGAWSDLGWAWNPWNPPSPSQPYSHPNSPRSILVSKARSRGVSGEFSPTESPRGPSPSGHARPALRWTRNTPARRPPSPELIESSVILFYGATNTFMERFGAAPGSPYTAKQIQHISIAVMYFFAGCLGVALELGWLSRRTRSHDTQSASYKPSYNPFAALCIGITGIAMAVHHQTYVFQVQIHMLWGVLLALYAPARIFTYLMMWARSPREASSETDGDATPPSPPPTEAIAAFFLTSGGVAFISSTEQIGFWAMRSGRDDVMMFANAIVALVFLCFTWVFGILAVKTWADGTQLHSAVAAKRGAGRAKRVSFEEAHDAPVGYQTRAEALTRGSN
ncbi:hypothetical protein FRB98_007510 [Tulasnella sp. 332]|nr:hypothetical protein FRB98_007510 [Tulasnella sp. 332]